ncbi:uncharacterized protein LOC110250096 [Exaiptasia diaphana]|uniref:Chitin-binding type-4 domain-containing protein n=1 Tax=Exaiptasia diaphana TaxID=2652724 RepID=A0A913XZS4_EXADI|nr:uncharacterized protein LOC110250096 [Exaiptasia diaphana]
MAIKVESFAIVLANVIVLVLGHGYMIDPPARNACWKEFGQCVPNYTPNELNCGGRPTQIANDGKCGVCGDRVGTKKHVYPGRYATGFITRTYRKGQEITAKIHITANHKGWFEFRVGDIGAPPITQPKLSYLLTNSLGKTRYPLRGSGNSYETIKLRLPAGLTCRHCVLQWWWKVGNSWGCDADGCGLGHGHQETFVNCADIQIAGDGGIQPPTQAPPPPPTQAPPPPPTQAPPPPPTLINTLCPNGGALQVAEKIALCNRNLKDNSTNMQTVQE